MIKFDRENFTLNINAADVNTLIVALLEHKEKASTLKGFPGGSGFMIQVAVDLIAAGFAEIFPGRQCEVFYP